MAEHRTDRVFLPADVTRCEPANPCPQRGHCARYLAELPRYGRLMGHGLPVAYPCREFLSAEAARLSRPVPIARPVKDPPRGLR